MAVKIMIVMILVACRLVTGEPVDWGTIRVLQIQSLEQKGVLQTLTQQQTALQQESAILRQNYSTLRKNYSTLRNYYFTLRKKYATLFKNYTRDITNIKTFLRGTPFSTCDGAIPFTGTKIKYPLTGKYTQNEHCQWTIDAGKVTLSIPYLDLEGGMHDYVEIWNGGSIRYRINQVFYDKNPHFSPTLDGVITIKFISDSNKEYTGFTMNINAGH